ncbi:hypothetical protein RIF29_42044 [Crotalaria pallida]|uniref:Peptidase C1A papain C-terminal domain-containing protein n=1 Tax=Crotalaria pallida TaxID=3830 RepID=A0AAN9E8F5_CROPI
MPSEHSILNHEVEKTYLHEVEKPSKRGNTKVYDDSCENLPDYVDWRERGAVTEVRDQGKCQADYPYIAQDGTCKDNASNVVSIDNFKVLDGSEKALLCSVSKQPVSARLDASYIYDLYHNGIYDGLYCSADSKFTNHSVLIVGYGSVDGVDYWIVKNSWGKKWGKDGYLYLRRNVISQWPYGVCGINTAAGYPIKHVSSSLST